MNPLEIEADLKNILNGYPNTYTFTKSLAEKSILKKRGTLPCCLLRPSMIGSSLREPYVGWVDCVSALGGPIFFGGIGVYNYQVGYGAETIDLVAVDQCINHILIATAYCSTKPEELHIFNHTSSAVNPLKQLVWNQAVCNFNKYYPYDRQVRKPSITFAGSPKNRDLKLRLFHQLPVKALNLYASIPGLGTKAMQTQAKKMMSL